MLCFRQQTDVIVDQHVRHNNVHASGAPIL